jgi:hypothetical protein
VWQFPEIKDIFPGSINLEMDTPLQNPTYDYTTLPTPWWDVDPRKPDDGKWAVEKFSFLRIWFEYPAHGPAYRAWIFGCHNSRWFCDPYRFEVIAEKIVGLSYGGRCRIRID